MENENIPQPLDTIMNELGLSNADLVNASKEQLSFKMVQKGRKGRRLTPKIQEKILRALLALKPDLKTRRRDLFRYEASELTVELIKNALTLVHEKKIKYPQYIDLLMEAGITRYAVDVAKNRATFYAPGGEAHIEEGPITFESPLGRYGEAALRSAISAAQKEAIDYATFLKRIYDAGISSYEVNIGERKIQYKGLAQSYKELIPLVGAEPAPEKEIEKVPAKKVSTKKKVELPEKPAKKKKKGKLVKKSNSVKARRAKKALKRERVTKRKKR